MKRLLTHGTALAAGICLAWGAAVWRDGGAVDGDDLTDRQPPPRRASPAKADTSPSAGGTSDGRFSAYDYQAAWDAIAHRSVTRDEREAQQRVVLEAWAETDLRGAMRAAARNDMQGGILASSMNLSAADAVSPAISQDPERAWAILQEPEFRFRGKEFFNILARAVAADMPVLAAMLPRLPQRLRLEVVENILPRNTEGNAISHKEEVMRLLSGLPDAVQARELVRKFTRTQEEWQLMSASIIPLKRSMIALTPEKREALLQRVTEAPTAAERMVAEEAYFRTMTDGAEGTLMERWRALPEEARGRAADAVVASTDSGGPLREIVAMIRESGRNDLLKEKALTSGLWSWARSWKKDEAAEGLAWTLSLPAVPEMDAVFNQTITGYADSDVGELREWIGTLPAGWHRDRALAVYAEYSAVEMEDKAWAREQIADPEVRKRLEE